MLFWHLGATLWLFRWIFKDPKVDVRFLLAGAVIPDLVDLALGTLILADRYASGELWSHTLLMATIYMIGVLLLTRRGRRRRAFMALGVGWLFHILLDGMWNHPEVLFWPSFGWEMPAGEARPAPIVEVRDSLFGLEPAGPSVAEASVGGSGGGAGAGTTGMLALGISIVAVILAGYGLTRRV